MREIASKKNEAISKSERRDSNSRHPPWQGGALPTELLSRKFLIAKISYLNVIGQCCFRKRFKQKGFSCLNTIRGSQKKNVFNNFVPPH